jgi:hypothetical protein
MEDQPLHIVDLDETEEPATVPTGVLSCHECTILIGPGYLESEPFPHPQGQGVVCGQCLESLLRRALRAADAEPKSPPPWGPRRHPS